MKDEHNISESNGGAIVLAGILNRLGAFFVDSLLLGVAGFILGMYLADQFVRLEGFGPLIGFCVAGLYFGLLDSRMTNGQTIGKRLAGIKVIDRNGKSLTVQKSLFRYSILGAIYFINGMPSTVVDVQLATVLTAGIDGIGVTILYLFLFNRATKQSLHDVLAGSYVVYSNVQVLEDWSDISPNRYGAYVLRSERKTTADLGKVWPVHYGVCLLVVLTVTISSWILGYHDVDNDTLQELSRTRTQLQAMPEVLHVNIYDAEWTDTRAGGRKITNLTVHLYLVKDDTDNEKLAEKAAGLILQNYRQAKAKDGVDIVLLYGYDVGIFSSWRRHNYGHSPKDWLIMLGK